MKIFFIFIFFYKNVKRTFRASSFADLDKKKKKTKETSFVENVKPLLKKQRKRNERVLILRGLTL